jgi:hypothetical protein
VDIMLSSAAVGLDIFFSLLFQSNLASFSFIFDQIFTRSVVFSRTGVVMTLGSHGVAGLGLAVLIVLTIAAWNMFRKD